MPTGKAEIHNAFLDVSSCLDFSFAKAAVVERFHNGKGLTQFGGKGQNRLLFDLPPPRPCLKNDMLLPAHGYYCQRRIAKQQLGHCALIAFGTRRPLAIYNKMGVITHPLGLVLADQRRQILPPVVEGK